MTKRAERTSKRMLAAAKNRKPAVPPGSVTDPKMQRKYRSEITGRGVRQWTLHELADFNGWVASRATAELLQRIAASAYYDQAGKEWLQTPDETARIAAAFDPTQTSGGT